MRNTTTQPSITINVEHDITLDRISNLLCSAFEGGSNYWYQIQEFVDPKEFTFRTDENQLYKHLDYPLNEGGAVIVGDLEDEDAKPKRLDLDAIKKGLVTMSRDYPRHMMDFINDNDDATTGDVFLQCCLFGDVIYG